MKIKRLLIAAPIALSLSACATLLESTASPLIPMVKVIFPPQVTPEVKNTANSAIVVNMLVRGQRKGEGKVVADYLAEELVAQGYSADIRRMDYHPENEQDACDVVKDKGMEMAILGDVEELTYGGISTDSIATLSVRILNANDCSLAWWVKGTANAGPRFAENYVVAVDRGKEAPRPLALAGLVAGEIAKKIAGKPMTAPPKPVEHESITPKDQGDWGGKKM